MKYTLFVFVLLFVMSVHAQKRMTKSFSTQDIKAINFKLDQVYKITINTHLKPEVLIEAQVEGEHNEHLVLTRKQLFGSLLISCDFQPSFKAENDKLSAHKVLSVELSITVPENQSVYLKSDLANVTGSGQYKKLTLELSNGYCNMTELAGNILINTIKGNIDIQTTNTRVEAFSQNGALAINGFTYGKHKAKLTTIDGDISVTKSQ